jgi:Protein of unknown function (DUF732)
MITRLVLAVGVALVSPLATATTARADGTDDYFLTKLESEGINDSVSPAHVIQAGHFVCVKLDNGSSPAEVMKDVGQSSGLPADASGFFVGASIDAYCPRHANDIPPGA